MTDYFDPIFGGGRGSGLPESQLPIDISHTTAWLAERIQEARISSVIGGMAQGKTVLMTYLAAELGRQFNVCYIDSDKANATSLFEMQQGDLSNFLHLSSVDHLHLDGELEGTVETICQSNDSKPWLFFFDSFTTLKYGTSIAAQAKFYGQLKRIRDTLPQAHFLVAHTAQVALGPSSFSVSVQYPDGQAEFDVAYRDTSKSYSSLLRGSRKDGQSPITYEAI